MKAQACGAGRGAVTGIERGAHVVLSYQSCGGCRPCRSGRPADCARFDEANFGFQRLDGSNALHRSGVRGHFFGSPTMLPLAASVLNPNGRAALLTGANGDDSLPEGRKTLAVIQGDAVPQRFIPKLIEWYQAGRFPLDRLVTFYDFDDINRAIADAKRGDTIKPVLRMGRAPAEAP